MTMYTYFAFRSGALFQLNRKAGEPFVGDTTHIYKEGRPKAATTRETICQYYVALDTSTAPTGKIYYIIIGALLAFWPINR